MRIYEDICLWDKLKNATKPILLFGMGDGADKVLKVMDEKGIKVSGVFCSDDFYREKYFHGFKVLNYSLAKSIFKDMIVLMCFGSQRDDVFEIVKNIIKEQEFYVPDVPVFGDGVFDMEYFLKNQEKFEKVYSLLADEQSKKVYENVINFKLSGKPSYLFECETDNKEAFENIIKIGDNETYLDLGAYNADTILEFIEFSKGKYKRIVGVEPDFKNFGKLKKNTLQFKNIEYLNIAIDDQKGLMNFSKKGGRNSTLEKGHGSQIEVDTVDNICSDATYIKMDVEGRELKALMGAKNTIKNSKPKMLISAYHRNEDLFSLALYVIEQNPNYKIYVRHYKYLPAWDTNFYFI